MSEYRDSKGNLLKIGDRVKCIDNRGKHFKSADLKKHLTLNKIYTVLKVDIIGVQVQDDLNFETFCYSWRFIKVDCFKIKVRKLKKLVKKEIN